MTVPILVTRGKVLAAALVIGFVMAFTIGVVVFVALKVNDVQQHEISANRKAAVQAKQLARALQPSDADLAKGASRALRACLAQPQCLRALRGAIRRARLRRSDLPALRTPSRTRRPRAPAGGSPGRSSSGGGGSGTTTAPRRPAPTPSPPRPTPRPRPRAPRPRPAPQPPANPPAAPSPAPPAAPPAPAPSAPAPSSGSTPQPPPVPIPPPPPTLPVPVPPITLPGVCTPAVNVNCPSGSIDPGSNSGRGNTGDLPCERIKRPDLCPPGSSQPPDGR